MEATIHRHRDSIIRRRRVGLPANEVERLVSPGFVLKSFPAPGCFRCTRQGCGAPPSFFGVEPLEARRLFSVSIDEAGWTAVTPSGDARVIYVSNSSGSDGRSGGSPASAVKSIARGESLLRDGHGDQLLLKRGDVWHEPLGLWRKSGRSSQEPMVVGAYGEGARPELATGDQGAFLSGAKTDPEVDHLALIGLHFYADARDPASPTFRSTADCVGIHILSTGGDLLIEDCEVNAYGTNIAIENPSGPVHDVTIRRSVIADSYCTTFHSQGLYAEGVAGLRLEENVFDHNGWNDDVAGGAATIFNHDAYLNSGTSGVVVKGNIFANASSHGLQARAGGDVEDNLFLGDPLGLSFGLVRGATVKAGGVSGIVNGNLFLGARDINGSRRGQAIEVANTAPGVPTVISNNIIANDGAAGPSQGAFAAIGLVDGDSNSNDADAVGLNDLRVQGNIVYRWAEGVQVQDGMEPGGSGPRAINRVTIRDNDFQQIRSGTIVEQGSSADNAQLHWAGNRYDGAGSESRWIEVAKQYVPFATWAAQDTDAKAGRRAYANAGIVDGRYGAVTDGAAEDAEPSFLAEARLQSSQNWQTQYTALGLIQQFRDAFADTAPGATPHDWRAPTPPDASATLPASITTADASLTFTVTFTDDKAVDVSTVAAAQVSIVGPGGRALSAVLAGVTGDGSGPVVASYTVAAPRVVWRASQQGAYRVLLAGGAVKDTDGFVNPGGTIGKSDLEIVKVPPPPRVLSSKWIARTPQSFAVRFSTDVGATLDAADLVAVNSEGEAIDPAITSLVYDATSHVATWTFPGYPGGALPADGYHFSLRASAIADIDGRILDGNKDGLGGDDWMPTKLFTSKG